MATITSSLSGTSTVYVITDEKANTLTVTAAAPQTGGAISFASSASGLLMDGQILLQTLWNMLCTGLRPNVQSGSNASFTN
jgi:hypothetical protein